MRIVVIGGTGTIGKAVVEELSSRHEVLVVGGHSGDLVCDIASQASIQALFVKIGVFDALISTAGQVHFEELSKMTPEKYWIGLKDKLMGQVNLVLMGMEYIRDRGSFTLTSGVLSHDPIRTGSSASMVNGAVEGFVKGAAIELPRQIRINAVSPTVILESMDKYAPYFRGFDPVPVAKAALAYSKSAEGLQTGQVYHVG
jgi:NAD(P)-dependent dehydrogenase (short-subunit alcohol dehydrogenase family)